MAPKTVFVIVKYSKPGIQPPIYLAGSFSNPAWQPQEMLYTTNEANEHDFYKEVQVEEGHEYQYKFRVGEGDWWLLNEDSATVTDDAGNRNNLLFVPVSEEPSAEPKADEHPTISATDGTTSHSVAKMENIKPEVIGGEKRLEEAPTGKEVEMSEKESELPAAEEHTTITPAHTNTPAEFVTIEKEKEADELSTVPDTFDALKGAQHPDGRAEYPSIEDVHASSANEIDNSTKAQLVVDSVAELHASNATHTQEEEKQSNKVSQTPQFSEPVEPTSTPAVQVEPESSKASETIQSPTLFVEKVDDELRHGDDFGSAATVGQKDAHLLRSQDAEPDHVVMRAETSTPELANTAAEVFESAALLDRDPPTPPISDEEAGRIGYRRMSGTPIPEVARTAAEVMDVAATLDEGTPHIEIVPAVSELSEHDEDDPVDSGTSTPASQRAPKFSYECLRPEDTDPPVQCNTQPIDPLEPIPTRYQDIDWNDPSIEMFPTDRAAILDRLRRLSERMPEDVAEVDVVPPSPVVGPDYHPEQQLPALSPYFIAHEVSPSLDSIAEENDELLVSMPEVSKLTSVNREKETPAWSKELNDSTAALNGAEKPELEVMEKGIDTKSAGLEENEEPTFQTSDLSTEIEKPTIKDIKPSEETRSTENESSRPELSTTSESQNEKAITEQPKESPSVELPEGSGDAELTSNKRQTEKPTGTTEDESSVKVQEVAPETPPSVEQTLNETPRVPSPITPFVVGNGQLSPDDEEIQEITTGSETPNITVQPATPGTSTTKTEFTLKPLDEAKSTAIEEENGRTQVKSRKQPRSQSPERPVTPTSLRSAHNDAKSRNFLKAFWRVLFVDWIGGLIRALCGGGRGGYTLLAVGAIVLVAFAPALYSSFNDSALWV